MNIFQARILSDGDVINKSNSRQAQTMVCQRIMESTRTIFTCVHKSLFAFHLWLPFILKSSANPALREQRKVTLSLFIKSSHFSDLSERTILTTSFVLLHHEIQEQKPLNHSLKHTISFSFSLKVWTFSHSPSIQPPTPTTSKHPPPPPPHPTIQITPPTHLPQNNYPPPPPPQPSTSPPQCPPPPPPHAAPTPPSTP